MQPLGIEPMNSPSTTFYGGKELSFGTEIIHAKLKYNGDKCRHTLVLKNLTKLHTSKFIQCACY
jgi:hypothetical protein